MQAARPTAPSDDELATRARTGNQEAFAALYDRYLPGAFDFALRTVRNRETAADVVQRTFATAWSMLRRQGPAESVKASFYTVARDCAIDELRQRKRGGRRPAETQREGVDFTRVDANRSLDASVLADKELLEVVWDAAEALSPEAYSLLDLHVRRGLEAGDLAGYLGLKAAAVDTRLAHLVDAFDDSVRTALLARRGGQDCGELEALLSRLGADYVTADVRSAVEMHARACYQCQESKRRYVSPAEILRSFAPVPPTPGLHWQIWREVDPHAEGHPVRARRARRWFPWQRS